MTSRLATTFTAALLCAAGSLVSAQASASGEVTLARANSSEVCAEGLTSQSVSYAVYVKNLAYAKTVSIHEKNADGTWSDVPAHYVESAAGGALELWKAEVSSYGAHSLDFAVSYTTNGATYWDNNGGKNYSLGADDGALLGRGAPVLLSFAYAQGAAGGFSGEIAVANLAYQKKVEVVYTTNDWATSNVVAAAFFGQSATGCGDYDSVPSPNPEGVERWRFSVPSVSAASVKFAISYTVDGTTYWDNNLGSNYTATASGANGVAGQ